MTRPRPYDEQGCPITLERYKRLEAHIDRPLTDPPFAGSYGSNSKRSHDAIVSALFTLPDTVMPDRPAPIPPTPRRVRKPKPEAA